MAFSKLSKLEEEEAIKSLRGIFDFDESLSTSEIIKICKAKLNEFHDLIKKSLKEIGKRTEDDELRDKIKIQLQEMAEEEKEYEEFWGLIGI